jgi:hypothetical protein
MKSESIHPPPQRQSLYHNLLLQDAVLNMQAGKPAGAAHGGAEEDQMTNVIAELQRAFTHMKLNHHGIVDLSRFVGKSHSLLLRLRSRSRS